MPSPEPDQWWEREVPFEELEANAKIIRSTPYGLQDGNGVDITLIDVQLALSPAERIRVNDQFARAIERRHAERPITR